MFCVTVMDLSRSAARKIKDYLIHLGKGESKTIFIKHKCHKHGSSVQYTFLFCNDYYVTSCRVQSWNEFELPNTLSLK